MLTLNGLIRKAKGKLNIYRDFRLRANKNITQKLTICIPDTHLLERGPNDDFLDGKPEYEERFLALLDFLMNLRQEEGEGLEIV